MIPPNSSPLSNSPLKKRSEKRKSERQGNASSLLSLLLKELEEGKAEDCIHLEVQGKTSLADDMIIASGGSTVHVGALADRLMKKAKEQGCPVRVEGLPQNDWVLLDFGDVIVHLFRPQVRSFYNLEKLWGQDRPQEK